MQLKAANLERIDPQQLELPAKELLSLPEKVLQFGTGVLLRGLPDYFIDKANKQGLFNGRIVVVKSTDKGLTDAFEEQDGLYTLLERGIDNGTKSEQVIINASISKVYSAATQWPAILSYAGSADMQVIISNTTEVGISLVEGDAHTDNPVSFPGRLLAFLLARFDHFKGSEEAGMVIIPTELITNNGAKLKAIVTELARLRNASEAFIQWLHHANDFCNSLVDRIVPGKPGKTVMADMEETLGYTDELMIMSETYRLWAIETKRERTHAILSFAAADKGVVLASDINKFRELKLRLLNGTHTFTCGLARLAGFTFVKDALEDEVFTAMLSTLMLEEIVPVLAGEQITKAEAKEFAEQVIDRFRNPYINHQWQHITVQYTAKMAMRNIPLLQAHFQTGQKENFSLMAIGFAGYLLYLQPGTNAGENLINKMGDPITDEQAAQIFAYWQQYPNPETLVPAVLGDKNLWGTDMTVYKDLEQQIIQAIHAIQELSVMGFIRSVFTEKVIA